MSDSVITCIPQDYLFQPRREIIEKIHTFFSENNFSFDPKTLVNQSDKVSFVDPGSNFVSVSCPKCNKELDKSLWQELMSKAYDETQFTNLEIVLPCCNVQGSLNALIYNWDAGFSKFNIQFQNSNMSEEDVNKILNFLEEVCGSSFKVIYYHY